MFAAVRLFLACTVFSAVVFVSFGCGGETGTPSATGISPTAARQATTTVQVTNTDSDGSVTLNPGDTLEVILTSNASTGYHWIITSLNQDILQQADDSEYEADPNPQGLVGAGGNEIFTFKAMAAGETSLKMNYQSPSNTPSDTNFNYSVKVS